MADNLFKKYRARIVREGLLKSSLVGVAVGAGVLALTLFFSWLFAFKMGLWLGIGLCAAAVALSVPLVYFLKFRPTTKEIAKRIDELGLEERVLTMVELEGDDSYIAQKQREDTKRALGKVDHMLLKFAVSTALIVTAAVCAVAGLGMTTVQSLYYADVIGSGLQLMTGEKKYGEFLVTYTVQGRDVGYLIYWPEEGDWEEELPVDAAITVKEGDDAPAVLAVPAANYVFSGWSDGARSPYRKEENVQCNLSFSAIFTRLDETVDEDEEPPQMSGNGEGNGQNGQGNNGPKPGGAMHDNFTRDNPANQAYDGETYYGDNFQDAYDTAADRLGSDGNIPDSLKGFIFDCFDAIAQDGGEGEGEGGE